MDYNNIDDLLLCIPNFIFDITKNDQNISLIECVERLERLVDGIQKKMIKRRIYNTGTRAMMRMDNWNKYLALVNLDNSFQMHFRMSFSCFQKTLSKIKFSNHKNSLIKSSNSTQGIPCFISHSEMLGIALRWFSGEPYQGIIASFKIGRSTFYKYLHKVIDAIINSFPDVIKFPMKAIERLEISKGFSTRTKYPFLKCIGALDGTYVQMAAPCVKNKLDYLNRKNQFSFNIQAICNHEYKFIYLSVRAPGRTSDQYALSISSFYEMLQNDKLNLEEDEFIVADEGYKAESHIVTPFHAVHKRRSHGEVAKDNANYYISSNRISIEQTFGIWKARFPILTEKSQLSIINYSKVIQCAAILHNICISENSLISSILEVDNRSAQIYESEMNQLNNIVQIGGKKNCPQREIILEFTKNHKISRPNIDT